MHRFPLHWPMILLLLLPLSPAWGARAPVSEATEECLACHASLHPGIVSDWQNSRHAEIAPETALEVTGLARKVSAETVPESLRKTAVGCAECHTLRPEAHADTFDHVGAAVHVVVSPDDCAVCHTQEARQYSENLMSHAHGNLTRNPVYRQLETAVLGTPVRGEDGKVTENPPSANTRAEGCLYCHGTRLTVRGMTTRDTMLGEMLFPKIDGWPNQGVGRINPDGSRGSCAACHTRHAFSIETARKPYTCKECHVGPDVPAYKVYSSSKHGNLFSTHGDEWSFDKVPWTVGADFTAPTCATCHISLVVNTDGAVVAERTHRMSGRLPWRIFGLIYAHPHPENPDTTTIRNREGLPLPTSLDGTFAADHLIGPAEQARRTETMQTICRSCHQTDWVTGHWERFESTIRSSNDAIRTATEIMGDVWSRGYARGIAQGENPFDESVERLWSDAWLFYGNTIRFASAMGGGGDYGVFADGRYHLNRTVRDLADWLELRTRLFPPEGPVADSPGDGVPKDGPRLSLSEKR